MNNLDQIVFDKWKEACRDCDSAINELQTRPWWKLWGVNKISERHSEAHQRWMLYFDLLNEIDDLAEVDIHR